MHCGHCGAEATHRCGGCKNVHYCTLECQQADWRTHKSLCKSFAAFVEKPNENVRRVIFLPENDSTPVFMWQSVEGRSGSNLIMEKLLGEKQTTADALLVSGHGGSGRLLQHAIKLVHRDDFMGDAPNKCLASLLVKEIAERWRGPLLIIAAALNERFDPLHTLDIDTSSFSIALGALREFTVRLAQGPPWDANPTPPKKIKGVKFNSTSPFVEEVNVPLKHPVFKSGTPLPIMDMMRYPMKTYKYPAAPPTPFNQSSSSSDTAPFDATWLRVCLDTASPTFGRPPSSFLEDGASVLVVSATRAWVGIPLLVSAVRYIRTWFGNISDMDEQNRVLFLQALDEDIAGVMELFGVM